MSGRPAVLLDRDGTLIEEREYLAEPAHVALIPGTVEALRRLSAAGYALVLVSNQSGIARGLFDEGDYERVHARLVQLLAAEGVRLDGAYHCPHHPEHTGNCECRKPAPGLFLRAARDLGLDLGRSVLVGDRVRDVAAAEALGARAFLVETGYGARERSGVPPWMEIVPDLGVAADRILGGG